MENLYPTENYPYFCYWDVDKYQSKYPSEHWDLCRLFMVLNITKYPEARLVQLTDAFYKKGVYGVSSDPKTNRLVAALSIPVVEHLLQLHPRAVGHPFMNQDKNNPIDISSKDQSRAEGFKPSSGVQNKRTQDPLERVRQAEQATSVRDDVTQQGGAANPTPAERGGNFNSSKFTPSRKAKPSFDQEKQMSLGDQATAGLAKNRINSRSVKRPSIDQKSSAVPEPKQMHATPQSKQSANKDVVDEHYRIKKAMDTLSMKTLFIGFVIIRGVAKDSTLCNYIVTIEDSFQRCKFGPCTWVVNKADDPKGLVGVKLQWRDNVLVEAEGQNLEFVKLKMAARALSCLEEFSPVIKANEDYYNNGKCRELPQESPKGPCWHYLNRYTYNHLKEIIDRFIQKKDLLEMIVLHQPECQEEFFMQDIVKFIETERADVLKYRLAVFLHQGKARSAICLSYNHRAMDLYEWLDNRKDQRYSVTFSSLYKTEFQRFAHRAIPSDTPDWERDGEKDRGKPNHGNSIDSSATMTKHQYSSVTNSSSSDEHLAPFINKQHPALAPPTSNAAKKEKREGLSWVGKEHLSKLGKSIYLVKMVKEDSTTETNPFNLLKTTCSLEYNVDFKYVMNRCGENGLWEVLVVLIYDRGNILVGEARAGTCAEARLAAAQDAINTIQCCCRMVEPNFKYFAEGGVPTFISLKYPMKTSTYEIMNMDTSKNPLNEQVICFLLQMFIEDKITEDIFFLACDFTKEERECVRKIAMQINLGWRLFGIRSRNAPQGDISTQNLCVYRHKAPVELVKEVITLGGTTDKYSVVINVNKTIPHSVVDVEPSIPSEQREICVCESMPGGCINPKCYVDHVNILDHIVNQYFGVR